MDNQSKPNFQPLLEEARAAGKLSEKLYSIILAFYTSYFEALRKGGGAKEEADAIFTALLDRILEQLAHPYPFELFHKKVRAPFDYYQFGCDFLLPLIDQSHSTLRGVEHLKQIEEYLKQGDNVVFFANHQIEADPQAIAVMMEKAFPTIVDSMICVAGKRVIEDPLAIPFSLGCNLLCIYSKRYIDHPPEEKRDKQLHNKKTMQRMSELLSEGGKCVYVAPSGGRDRKDARGEIQLAPFDPNSIEMFYLMAERAKTPTHFFPMALCTYEILPPPDTVQVELGEKRSTKRAPIHISIGAEIDMEHFPGNDIEEKQLRRKARSDYIWHLVDRDYRQLSE